MRTVTRLNVEATGGAMTIVETTNGPTRRILPVSRRAPRVGGQSGQCAAARRGWILAGVAGWVHASSSGASQRRARAPPGACGTGRPVVADSARVSDFAVHLTGSAR